jgi:signal peptidase I
VAPQGKKGGIEIALRLANVTVVACVVVIAAALLTGAITLVRVAGGSMSPTLWPGDLCLVVPCDRPTPRQVVLFTPPGHEGLVLHRVKAASAKGLVTQGDANQLADRETVPLDAVAGRVTWTLPLGAWMHRWQVASSR